MQISSNYLFAPYKMRNASMGQEVRKKNNAFYCLEAIFRKNVITGFLIPWRFHLKKYLESFFLNDKYYLQGKLHFGIDLVVRSGS